MDLVAFAGQYVLQGVTMHRSLHAPLIAAMLLIAAGCTKQADCKGTAQVCNGSCVELKSDNLNCGACGTVCSAGQVCSNGACTVTCAAGLLNCGGHCIDPATDRTHCGASGACTGGTAGAACGDGQLCSAGQCVQTCSDAQAACPVVSPTYCADLARDANNCGACGATCAVGQQCVTSGGTTSCACPAATPDACGSGTSAFCTSTATDPANCGGCGTVCGAGTVCSGGQCVQSCSAAEVTACPAVNPTYCANTANDANNCGDCGTVCAAGQQCSAGQCACPAATPSACTTGGGLAFCANVATDSLNCGSCGHACGTGEVCVSGTCTLTCAGGATKCAGACVDTKLDTANCGACGNVCPAGQVCSNSTCALTCAGGSTKCGTACVDTRNDVANCGACGTTCAAGQVCANGACALSCAGGSTQCGTTCVDTKNDPANCGGCNVACGAGQVCSNGACGTVCPVGEYACSGKCIDPQSDPNYCGAAADCAGGAVCPTATACRAGACVPVCSWSVAESYSLASAPPGSQLIVGAGSGTYTTANGRTGLLMSSTGAALRVPTAVTAQTFAVDLDFYTAAGTATMIGEWVFSNPGPGAFGRVLGQGFSLTDMAPLGRVLATSVYKPTDLCNGWAASECAWTTPNGYARQTTPVGSFVDGWHTLRVEGDRSSCRFRTYQDGKLLDTYAGVCDTSGSNVYFGVNGTAMFTNYKVYAGTPECIRPVPKNCAEVLSAAPGAASGQYVIDPDGPGGAAPYTAYCDMTTAGGGWTLVLAYDHPAGGTAATVPGTVPVDPAHGYSHLSAAQLGALPFSSMRFYCQTSAHPRKIDAIFSDPGVVSFAKGASENSLAIWQTYSTLPDHTGFLPAATSNVDLGIPVDQRLTREPFFKASTYHWLILPGTWLPQSNRFECDDYAAGPAFATLHQIWVR